VIVMKRTVSALEPYARALLRLIVVYMIVAHGLREVFGLLPARPKGPGSFMALDPLGQVGGILLLVCGALLLIGWMTRISSLILAIQCFVAYFYAAAPRGTFPIRNGGIEPLAYAFVFLCFAAVGPGAWSVEGSFPEASEHGATGAPATAVS
jgi:putative oxidoreductase